MRLLISLLASSYVLFAGQLVAGEHDKAIAQAVNQAMTTFNVPGVAVAVVKNDKVDFVQGFGVIEKGSNTPVNADTLFGIASNTKAMTAAILASLVDEGKLTWQTPVVDILPHFQLHDPYVTREIQVQDLLAHNSGLGLGAGDLMIWPETDLSNEQILAKLKHVKPASSFRSRFAYNNLMFVVAGEVIATIEGKPWVEVIEERIFSPLKMNSTRAAYRLITDHSNVAKAHVPLDGKLQVVGGNFLEQFSSAGSVASSVNDMAKWLILQLNQGEISKDQPLFSSTQSRKMWRPHTNLSVSEAAAEQDKTQFNSYGLGWFVTNYHGYKLAHHSGGILGMVSKVVVVPEADLAMVILTNQQSGSAFNAIYREILESYLNLADNDWVNFYDERDQKYLAEEKKRLKQVFANRDKQSKPALPLKSYATTYRDKWYGDVTIDVVDKQLQMQFSHTPTLKGHLEHFQHNTFIVRWQDKTYEADAFVNFHLSPQGEVESMTINAVSYRTDFSFDFHDLNFVPVE